MMVNRQEKNHTHHQVFVNKAYIIIFTKFNAWLLAYTFLDRLKQGEESVKDLH